MHSAQTSPRYKTSGLMHPHKALHTSMKSKFLKKMSTCGDKCHANGSNNDLEKYSKGLAWLQARPIRIQLGSFLKCCSSNFALVNDQRNFVNGR